MDLNLIIYDMQLMQNRRPGKLPSMLVGKSGTTITDVSRSFALSVRTFIDAASWGTVKAGTPGWKRSIHLATL